MKSFFYKISIIGLLFLTPTYAVMAQKDNVLTAKEKKDGWQLIFDGKSSKGWRGVYLPSFPKGGWAIKDGTITHLKYVGAESTAGGDIVTDKEYSSFWFQCDFKISDGANSGIKYFVVEKQPKPAGSAIGLEFQILDDDKHPDAKLGINGNRTIGSLYDLIPAVATKKVKPIGEWNHALIKVKGNEVEHWLNGEKVVSYTRGSEQFLALVAGSKYKNFENFGQAKQGHILLQDHGDQVSFKNIKIKVL